MSQQPFVTSEVVSGQSAESYKVMYKPYQNDVHKKIPVTQEGMRRNEVYEDLQHEFSGNEESKQFLCRLETELKLVLKVRWKSTAGYTYQMLIINMFYFALSNGVQNQQSYLSNVTQTRIENNALL